MADLRRKWSTIPRTALAPNMLPYSLLFSVATHGGDGRGGGVGRDLADGADLGVGLGLGVDVDEGVAVGVADVGG